MLGKQALDTQAVYQVFLSASDGSGLAGEYDGTETFSANLLVGAGRAPVATLQAAWDADVEGNPQTVDRPVVALTVAPEAVALLAPNLYRVRLTLVKAGVTVDCLGDGEWIELVPGASGTGQAGPVYCEVADLRRVFPLIGELVQANPSLTSDFSEQREDARRWLDRQLMARVRQALQSQRSRHAPVVSVPPTAPADGADGGPTWGPSTIPDTTLRDQEEAFRGFLGADALLVDDGLAARISAHYAVYLACDGMPGEASSKDTWHSVGDHHRRRAASLLRGWPARLDTDGDGVADYELVY